MRPALCVGGPIDGRLVSFAGYRYVIASNDEEHGVKDHHYKPEALALGDGGPHFYLLVHDQLTLRAALDKLIKGYRP